jgi:N-acetylglucosaminyldiphosphoundecaprenol N-acetyl-beta-D-mannosaminyltransferase
MITNELPQTDFFGLKVSLFTKEELVQYIKESLQASSPRVYYGYSMGIITRFREYPELYHYVNGYDFMVTDGRLFYLVCKLCGLPLKHDISIPYLTELVLAVGNEKKATAMIVGSSKENNESATSKLREKCQNMVIYEGFTGGDFSENDYENIVLYVNRYRPDILLIGVSNPKKEYFTFKNRSKLNVKIIIPCGGMIDVLSGKTKRIPRVVKKIGIGWAWRIINEPGRFLPDKSFQAFQIIFRIIPIIIYHRYLKKDLNFFLPSIYGVKRELRQSILRSKPSVD